MNRRDDTDAILPALAAPKSAPAAVAGELPDRDPSARRVPLGAHRGRLFRKYLLLILSLMTGALLASGAISVWNSYQDHRTALANLQQEKAIAAASRIEQYMSQIVQQLSYAALPQLDAGDVELRRIEFLKLLRQVPEVTDIAQLDADGREMIAVSRLGMDVVGSGKDRSQEPAFTNPRRGKPWFGPVYFRKETEPYMTVAVRSVGDRGPVTIADVNLKFIWDVVSRIKIGEKGKAYVVDRNGYLVADPDIGLVLRKTNLSELPHVKAVLDRRAGEASAMSSRDLAGHEVLASVASIDSLDWRVFAEQPAAEVEEKRNESILRNVGLLFAGLVISAFAALALARGMVRPIRTLSEGAQRIGEGNLDQQIVVRTGDELEALADRFNRMTGQLKESYAGLERKVEERTSELKSSLDQQTAISEILRVISSSPTDVQPVLEAVAERAAHLCDAPIAQVHLVDGNVLRPAAVYAVDPGPGSPWANPEEMRSTVIPLQRGFVVGRAVVDRETLHYPDILPLLDAEYPGAKTYQPRFGFRALMAVPLMREGGAYGAILIWRREPRPFSPDQVALLQTFARQAAIAIDNVRLFNETREALDQQTAISEVLRVIASSPGDVRPMLDAVAERALRLCDAVQSTIVLVEGGHLRAAAQFGSMATLKDGETFPMTRGSVTGRAAVDRAVIHIQDLAAEPEVEYPLGREMQRRFGHRAIVSVPLLRDDHAIGVISLWRREPRGFTHQQVALVKTFADQAAIAIENVRLFNETKEALERQTAISEILRVISSSPTDVTPVLDAIAESAARLCEASVASLYLQEGDRLRHLASRGPSAEPVSLIDSIPITRSTISGRAFLERQAIQVRDVQAEHSEYPESEEIARRIGHRSVIVMPLEREGKSFGTILLRRNEVRPFEEREISLLRTFGDQAAIALENVRLFNETKEALDQQRASGEVLAAISGSIADTGPVFETILASCERLFGGRLAVIDVIGEDGLVRMGAYHGPRQDEMSSIYPHPADHTTATGRAIAARSVVQFGVDDGPQTIRVALQAMGVRAAMGAPMLWEGKGIGAIFVARDQAGAFSDKDTALLKTFADQAVIAIQNARLVNETREALEQQTATAEVLRVISGSVADTAPVFDKILDSCQRLFATEQLGIFLAGDDGMVNVGAWRGEAMSAVASTFPRPLDDTMTGTVLRERRTIHIVDAAASPDVPATVRTMIERIGNYSVAWAPMLWEDRGVGTICVLRQPPKAFTEKELALLKTFGDQAVISIQNARLFREIAEKSRQLEVANKHKSDFLASMSHELRTPLNAIIGFSEVLLERMFGDLNEKQDDYLKDIHSSGRHLLTLINDILDLSKVEAGRMDLEAAAFDLPSAIGNAMTLIRERAQRHAITLGTVLDPSIGEIVADERKVKQILLNLLSNAVKFTPDGGRIDVSAGPHEDGIVIAVKDTGIGIEPEDQEAVFEAFRQVGSDYATKQEGTGLGLALTRKFVELHGGRIWVESTPGAGSTFSFTLPRRS